MSSFSFGSSSTFGAPAPGAWRCPDCSVSNAPSFTACPCCGKAKPPNPGFSFSGGGFGGFGQQPSTSSSSNPVPSFGHSSGSGGGSSQVTADLEALLQSNDLTDVTFQVDGETIHAHKIILAARSEYFRNLLYGEMRESSATADGDNGVVITVQDVSAGSFRRILSYLYTGYPGKELKAHEAVDLLTCTDFYQLNGLKNVCETFLAGILSPGNALELLQQSRRANAAFLQQSAMNYIARHKNETVIKECINSLRVGSAEDGNLFKDLVIRMMEE